MNGQIVLCKGINDGEELERSIRDLAKYVPHLQSVSVVPVGLTKYREGLYPLEPFSQEDANQVIDLIEKWQHIFYKEYGLHVMHAGDEWYLLAERPLPEKERYDGYLQLENGVGMLRLLEDEFTEAFQELEGDERSVNLSMATGYLAYPHLCALIAKLQSKFPNVQVQIYPIRNDFFGEKITVSGLITGRDLKMQLQGKPLGDKLLLPCNMMRSGEEIFLDDVTLQELKDSLQVEVDIVKSSGWDLIEAIIHTR